MGRKNTGDAVLRRRMKVARLHVLGQDQATIGAKFGVCQSQISLDLKAIREEWRQRIALTIDDQKAEQATRLLALYEQAMLGWEKSQQDAERRYQKRITGGKDGMKKESGRTKEGQSGDPQFLNVAARCLSDMRDLFGLNAPMKVANTTPEGDALPPVRFIEIIRPGVPVLNGHHNGNGHSAG